MVGLLKKKIVGLKEGYFSVSNSAVSGTFVSVVDSNKAWLDILIVK